MGGVEQGRVFDPVRQVGAQPPVLLLDLIHLLGRDLRRVGAHHQVRESPSPPVDDVDPAVPLTHHPDADQQHRVQQQEQQYRGRAELAQEVA